MMYVVNSYLHVLKNIDSSWGDSSSSAGSKKSPRRWKSRSSSRKSRKDSHAYSSSSESGRYSEELVNSGYYGDDEIERCRCAKCLSEAQAIKPKQDFATDYDVISVDLSSCSTPKPETIFYRPRTQTNYDDYIIIPSSKEEFLAGNPAHSTPLEATKIRDLNVSGVLAYVSPIGVDIQSTLNRRCSCKLLEDTESESSSPKSPALQRVPSNGSGNCWWRDNIVWQLQQRNEAETKRFSQLQSEKQRCRAKIRINKELADYLNKYSEFRLQNDLASNTGLLTMEVEPIERSELVLAIRNHGTSSFKTEEVGESQVRSDSIAHLASTYLNRQRTLTEEKLTESEDSYSPGYPKSRMGTRFVKRAAGNNWRESIVNQLQMRNFLECRYFTDAVVRRTMSQLSISEKILPTHGRDLDEYDIITDDEVSSLGSRSTLMNSTHSTSQSQGYSSAPFSSRFFKRKRK